MKKTCLALFVTAAFAAAISLVYAEGFINDGDRVGYDNTPQQPWSEYRVHDVNRPAPVKLTIDPASVQFTPAPKNATVLFDGSNLDQWQNSKWIINKDKNLECTGGNIMTKEEFGDFQLHLEYRSPANFKGSWGNQGNNGVLVFDNVELQIFDNYTVNSYSDGLCGSVYGQFPPLVNACLPPGNWQTYDIFFRAPKYDAKGKMTDVKVIRGVDPLLDAEAVKVVSASPDWRPARLQGKRVASEMSLYVEFRLERKKNR